MRTVAWFRYYLRKGHKYIVFKKPYDTIITAKKSEI